MPDALDINSVELLQRAMASTPNRQRLLDTWIAIMGETSFYDFYKTFIFSDIFRQYNLLWDTPTIHKFDSKIFDSIYLQMLSLGMIETHKVIQRKACDPDNIKPILILFGMTKSHSAKGLSKWINPSYASSFPRVAEMLRADVPAERIPFGINNDIDTAILRSM